MSTSTAMQDIVTQVRRDILRMVHKVNFWSPRGSLGCAEFFVCLYNEILELNNGFSMDGKNEDLFSYPMATFLQYITVCWHEEAISVEELNTFRLINPVFKVTRQLMRVCLVFELLRVHWAKGSPLPSGQHRQKS